MRHEMLSECPRCGVMFWRSSRQSFVCHNCRGAARERKGTNPRCDACGRGSLHLNADLCTDCNKVGIH